MHIKVNIQLNGGLKILALKRKDIFRETILLCFLKTSISLKNSRPIVSWEIAFPKNSYHKKTSRLITLQIN